MIVDYATNPVAFFDDYIKVNELGQPFRLMAHQREIFRLAFDFDQDGRLPYDTIVYSCNKKSGKTTLNGGLTTWWGYTQEAPNELDILANDGEQAASRVFKTVSGIIRNNPELAGSAKVELSKITLSNGTLLQWLTCDHAGNAGSNHGWTSWDELWGYTSEASRRLWDEMTPVPTRRNSLRLITTYAGYENESTLLRELYLLGVGTDEHPDGRGARLHPTLPIYGNRDARLFVYWDHEPRMPWQTPAYYKAQRHNLRPNTFDRLHGNRWGKSESAYLTADQYDACVDQTHRPALPDKGIELYLGIDGSTKDDCAAVVALSRQGSRLYLVAHRIWHPSRATPLDLENTLEAYLLDLGRDFTVIKGLADPFQLHRSIMTVTRQGVPITDFPQTVGNTVRMGQALYDVIKGSNLILYPDDELRSHVLNAVAIETPRGFRIAKEKASRKIDACVALSMAVCAALDQPVSGPLSFMSEGRWIGAPMAAIRQAVTATTQALTHAVPVRSIEELLRENLYDRDLTQDEKDRLAAHAAKQQREHVDNEFERYLRAGGVHFPGIDGDSSLDPPDPFARIRQLFAGWRG